MEEEVPSSHQKKKKKKHKPKQAQPAASAPAAAPPVQPVAAPAAAPPVQPAASAPAAPPVQKKNAYVDALWKYFAKERFSELASHMKQKDVSQHTSKLWESIEDHGRNKFIQFLNTHDLADKRSTLQTRRKHVPEFQKLFEDALFKSAQVK